MLALALANCSLNWWWVYICSFPITPSKVLAFAIKFRLIFTVLSIILFLFHFLSLSLPFSQFICFFSCWYSDWMMLLLFVQFSIVHSFLLTWLQGNLPCKDIGWKYFYLSQNIIFWLLSPSLALFFQIHPCIHICIRSDRGFSFAYSRASQFLFVCQSLISCNSDMYSYWSNYAPMRKHSKLESFIY